MGNYCLNWYINWYIGGVLKCCDWLLYIYVYGDYIWCFLIWFYLFLYDFLRIFGVFGIKMVKNGKLFFVSGYLCAFFWINAYMQSNFNERCKNQRKINNGFWVILNVFCGLFYTNFTIFYIDIVKNTKNKKS